MGGNFRPESLATLNRNGWQLSSGFSISKEQLGESVEINNIDCEIYAPRELFKNNEEVDSWIEEHGSESIVLTIIFNYGRTEREEYTVQFTPIDKIEPIYQNVSGI
ncbi:MULTISPECIES: hypothetical protein [unclassified Oceanispirochaeta]|uniref:hypothetical protein n=1 Tax=unclassified Oceanispirochaeta TaxID=2635722 RepID=UPI000E0993E3|nr:MULTISPECIES: hypothetical protein [unclassified Oceanispirochaeta]MBF9019028.1 hypothetical protein [Oceanispirochaeta sp. M2]NPD75529.1 hypothetical protein [Oceanispirochaeta sp. M1]RDG28611.1 hypothetical protein DV872_25930 [Oceanispirochaeta sp. M1]